MAKKEKLLKKLLDRPKTFSYRELKSLLISIGFKEVTTGKTSGSRVAFYHKEAQQILRLHRPHPGDELKKYQIDEAITVIKLVIETDTNTNEQD